MTQEIHKKCASGVDSTSCFSVASNPNRVPIVTAKPFSAPVFCPQRHAKELHR